MLIFIVPVHTIPTSDILFITTNEYQQDYDQQPTETLKPDWEQLLTVNTSIKDTQKLTDILTSKQTINIATDGGAITATGLFGFVIANNTTTIATGGGVVEGADPDSFQAEAYGILAGLVNLRNFAKDNNIEISVKPRIISNSKSFLK